MNKITWLDDFHLSQKRVRQVCNEMQMLSHAFELIGNMQMSNTLDELNVVLWDAQEKSSQAISSHLIEESNNANNSLHETMNAILEVSLKK